MELDKSVRVGIAEAMEKVSKSFIGIDSMITEGYFLVHDENKEEWKNYKNGFISKRIQDKSKFRKEIYALELPNIYIIVLSTRTDMSLRFRLASNGQRKAKKWWNDEFSLIYFQCRNSANT